MGIKPDPAGAVILETKPDVANVGVGDKFIAKDTDVYSYVKEDDQGDKEIVDVSGGGGGGAVRARLSGNDVEVLHESTGGTRNALNWDWGNNLNWEFTRALVEADDDKRIVVDIVFTKNTISRLEEFSLSAKMFRNWAVHTATTGSGEPADHMAYATSRLILGAARGAMVARNRSSGGADIMRWIINGSSNNVALTSIDVTIKLVPEVDSLEIDGDTSAGGGDFHSVTGLPQPTADNAGQVYFNQHTKRAEAVLNVPIVSTRAVTTWASLADYYDNTGDGDEDMTVADVFPGVSAAVAADEDDYLYAIAEDQFYFGDTAPNSSYAWYHDNPEDALEALCNRYRTGESGTVIGASANIVYLGQLDSNNAATDRLHSLAVDLATTYYVYFNTDDFEFRVCDAFNATASVTQDHYQFVPILADQINPSVIVPGGHASIDPQHLLLNQLKLESGHLFYVKPMLHDGHGATFTWADYAGEGYTFTGAAAWRGTYYGVQSLEGIPSPQVGDRAFVSHFRDRGFYVYVTGHSVLTTGWHKDDRSPPGYTFIGYPASEADANGLAQEHVEMGETATTLLAFYGGQSNLRRLSAYSAPTVTHYDKTFEEVRTGRPGEESEDDSISGIQNQAIVTDIDVPTSTWAWVNFGDIGSDRQGAWTRFLVNDLTERNNAAAGDAPSDSNALMFFGNDEEKLYLLKTSADKVAVAASNAGILPASVRIRAD